jgi:hypothetical protein
MKYIVAGGRDFRRKRQMRLALDKIIGRDDVIISGGANGADDLGESYAAWRGVGMKKMPADWKKHGKAAGAIRNQQMAQYADGLIAFWDGRSKGTKDMIERAVRCSLEVHVYRYTT